MSDNRNYGCGRTLAHPETIRGLTAGVRPDC